MKFLTKIDIKTLLILVLIVVIVLMRACDGGKNNTTTPGQTVNVNGKPYVVIKHTRDTQYIPKNVVKYKKGETIYRDTPIYIDIPSDVDTFEILKDYYSKITYRDSITLDDSLGNITITDVISKNRIFDRKLVANINKMVITDTVILKEMARRQMYIGVNSSFTKENFVNSVGAGLLYKDRKDKVFSLGVGMQTYNNTLIPYLQGGLYWKIKLKN